MNTFIFVISVFIITNIFGTPISDSGFDESAAEKYLKGYYEGEASRLCNLASVAQFEYEINLGSNEAEEKAKSASIAYSEFELQEFTANISQFNHRNFSDGDLKRQFTFLNAIGTSALRSEELNRYNEVLSEMSKIYGQAKVCPYINMDCDLAAEGLTLEPDLTNILSEMQNFNEMAYYWKAWRDASGKKMRDLFNEYINLSNKAAQLNDYDNMGDFWLLRYETDVVEFRKELDDVWHKVKTELYEPLYDFVRSRLSAKFNQMDPEAAMPAHVFGNMWSQSWTHALPWVLPYPNATAFDITEALKKTANLYPDELSKRRFLFEFANNFFKRMGLEDMKMAYGQQAMIMKPKDKQVICHASAWDMCDKKDYRQCLNFMVKMCTEINHNNFVTVHHELGHIQYFLQYRNLPITYRTGANPGFHEAIGDVAALSVSTPKHLRLIGLLDKDVTEKSILNYLMQMALDKIAFLPFGYLIDSYRWQVFNGDIPRSNLTYNWIKMRAEIQGITPPFKRSEADFDAGAKYHVPANTPYIRYFISYILQFQIHNKLCTVAGQATPLHECDIYGNKKAGDLFKVLLKSGSSKNWKELLQEVTGEDKLNADAIISYFKPLMDHLKVVAKAEKYHTGWDASNIDDFYDADLGTPTDPTTTTTATTATTTRASTDKSANTTPGGPKTSPFENPELSSTENLKSTTGSDDKDTIVIAAGVTLAAVAVIVIIGYCIIKRCRKNRKM